MAEIIVNPNVAKVGGLQSQGVLRVSRSSLLRTRNNAGSEVLRLSPWVNNMAKNDPILRIHQWRYPKSSHFATISSIIANHYTPFAMLFMQLRGKFN
ncbi:MAG: hypothetical protein PVI77_22935, partial [Desulfobacterales bacterium]